MIPYDLLNTITQYFRDSTTWRNFSLISALAYQIYTTKVVDVFHYYRLSELLNHHNTKYKYNITSQIKCNGCDKYRNDHDFGRHRKTCEHTDYCEDCLHMCNDGGCVYYGCRECMIQNTNYSYPSYYCKRHFDEMFVKCCDDYCNKIMDIENYYYDVTRYLCGCGGVLCEDHAQIANECEICNSKMCDKCFDNIPKCKKCLQKID